MSWSGGASELLLTLPHHVLGGIEAARGNHEAAVEAFLHQRELWASRGDEAAVVTTNLLIVESQAELGRPDNVLRDLVALPPDILRASNPALTMNALGTCAHVLASLGQRERAVRALGSNWARAVKLGFPIEPESEEAWLQQIGIAAIRDGMPATRWEALIHAGKCASIEDAFADTFAPVSEYDDDGSRFKTSPTATGQPPVRMPPSGRSRRAVRDHDSHWRRYDAVCRAGPSV